MNFLSSLNREKRGTISFIAITFGITFFMAFLLEYLNITPADPLFMIYALPSGIAPAIAAILVRKWITKEGFNDICYSIEKKRWIFYCYALIIPFIVIGSIIILASIFSLSSPDYTYQRFENSENPIGTIPESLLQISFPILILILPILSILNTIIVLGEEFGWRSYLQTRIYPNHSLKASISIGLIHGFWYYPQILLGYAFPESIIWGLIAILISTTLLAIIWGWLYLKVQNIWIASFAHSSMNVIGGFTAMLLFFGGPNWIFVSHIGILSWIPLGTIAFLIIWKSNFNPSD